MVQLILIAAFIAIRIADQGGGFMPTLLVKLTAFEALLAISVSLALLAFIFAVITTVAGRRLDRRGDVRAYHTVRNSHGALRLVGAGAFIAVTTLCAAPMLIRAALPQPPVFLPGLADILLFAPLITYILALWALAYPVEARLSEAALFRSLHEGEAVFHIPSRFRYVLDHFRHQVLLIALPILLMSIWNDSLGWLKFRNPSYSTYIDTAGWLGIIPVMLLSPALIRVSWHTSLLTTGPCAAYAAELFRTHKVKISGPYVWHTGGSMINAVVLGIIFPLRYILLTDRLLEELEETHLRAVLGHEVAHVKHKHLLWILLAVVASVLAAGWATSIAAYLMAIDIQSGTPSIAVACFYPLVAFVTFTYISRRFEQQADTFAAADISRRCGSQSIIPLAAASICGALDRVCALSGTPRTAPSWRHGSIATRCENIARIVGHPLASLPIDRTVRLLKVTIAITLAASIGLFFLWPA